MYNILLLNTYLLGEPGETVEVGDSNEGEWSKIVTGPLCALSVYLKQGLLAGRGLKLHEVPSDGDCMFASVAHQLGKALSVADLRKKTGEELRKNKSAYWPFLSRCFVWPSINHRSTHALSPKTGEPFNDAEYDNYCKLMESTPAWGGQVQYRWISHCFMYDSVRWNCWLWPQFWAAHWLWYKERDRKVW